jgi:outer membrane protein assembly factor BamB
MRLRACAFLLLLSAVAAGADWPRFRGPNGTGTSDDKDVPVTFSDAENVLWKADLGGRGNSSPVVSGGRVYLQTAAASGSKRSLLCLDAASGRKLWERDAPGTRVKTHDKNTLASSTPACDGQRVYAAFWDGAAIALCAYSTAGDLAWKQSLGAFESQHGAGLSPVVYEGVVFVNLDQDGAAALLAFDAKSGEKLWQKERPAFRACYSTPFLLDGELIVASTAGITAYRPKTGEEVWRFVWDFSKGRMPLRTVSSPIASNGLVFATSGDGAGDRWAIAVKVGGKGTLPRSALAWENRKTLPYVPTLLALGEHLYSVNDVGIAACHVAATGEEVWSHRLADKVAFTASPVLIDGKVYAASENGRVFVFAATPEKFTPLATNKLGDSIFATPAVADGRLYVRSGERLYCVSKAQAKGR